MKDATILSSPWYNYLHKMKALFEPDPEISVSDDFVSSQDSDDSILYLTITSDNIKKYNALRKLLKPTVEFGNVTVNTIVKFKDTYSEDITVDDYADLFKDNPLFSSILTYEDPITKIPVNYVVFAKKVVQYFDDTLSDPAGIESNLAEIISREIFVDTNFRYTTSVYDLDDINDEVAKCIYHMNKK